MGFYNYNSDVLERPTEARLDLAAIMRQVYLWMFVGLLTTAGVAFFVGTQPALVGRIVQNPWALLVLVIVELVLVLFISARINKLNPTTAIALFLVYAAVNGLVLSTIFLGFKGETIAYAAVASSAMFGITSLFAYTTKMDLSRLGNLLFTALIGLMIATVVNIFIASTALFWIINYAGVLIFVGLTAWDTQKIKNMAQNVVVTSEGSEAVMAQRVSIIGALILYLDFINLFLFILRILGAGNRR